MESENKKVNRTVIKTDGILLMSEEEFVAEMEKDEIAIVLSKKVLDNGGIFSVEVRKQL